MRDKNAGRSSKGEVLLNLIIIYNYCYYSKDHLADGVTGRQTTAAIFDDMGPCYLYLLTLRRQLGELSRMCSQQCFPLVTVPQIQPMPPHRVSSLDPGTLSLILLGIAQLSHIITTEANHSLSR